MTTTTRPTRDPAIVTVLDTQQTTPLWTGPMTHAPREDERIELVATGAGYDVTRVVRTIGLDQHLTVLVRPATDGWTEVGWPHHDSTDHDAPAPRDPWADTLPADPHTLRVRFADTDGNLLLDTTLAEVPAPDEHLRLGTPATYCISRVIRYPDQQRRADRPDVVVIAYLADDYDS